MAMDFGTIHNPHRMRPGVHPNALVGADELAATLDKVRPVKCTSGLETFQKPFVAEEAEERFPWFPLKRVPMVDSLPHERVSTRTQHGSVIETNLIDKTEAVVIPAE